MLVNKNEQEVTAFDLHLAFDRDNKFEGDRHAYRLNTISIIHFVTKVTPEPRVFFSSQKTFFIVDYVEVKVRTHYTS